VLIILGNLGGEYHFPKIRYRESNFSKKMKYQCNLHFFFPCELLKKEKAPRYENGRPPRYYLSQRLDVENLIVVKDSFQVFVGW
jgi:hypothetical protein